MGAGGESASSTRSRAPVSFSARALRHQTAIREAGVGGRWGPGAWTASLSTGVRPAGPDSARGSGPSPGRPPPPARRAAASGRRSRGARARARGLGTRLLGLGQRRAASAGVVRAV